MNLLTNPPHAEGSGAVLRLLQCSLASISGTIISPGQSTRTDDILVGVVLCIAASRERWRQFLWQFTCSSKLLPNRHLHFSTQS
jgi:hypothetical protein